jgi:hypothetical protein
MEHLSIKIVVVEIRGIKIEVVKVKEVQVIVR